MSRKLYRLYFVGNNAQHDVEFSSRHVLTDAAMNSDSQSQMVGRSSLNIEPVSLEPVIFIKIG